MAVGDLPDMYARSPRATGPRAEGIHIRQTYQANHEWPCYNYYVSLCSHSNNTSSLNTTSKYHACSQGYKYKLLMPIVKELSAYIYLLYSGNTLYKKPSE